MPSIQGSHPLKVDLNPAAQAFNTIPISTLRRRYREYMDSFIRTMRGVSPSFPSHRFSFPHERLESEMSMEDGSFFMLLLYGAQQLRLIFRLFNG